MTASDWWGTVAYFNRAYLLDRGLVYHRQRPFEERKVDGPIITMTTRCGIVTDRWNRETGEQTARVGVLVRREYADLFARPCRKCWKEEL